MGRRKGAAGARSFQRSCQVNSLPLASPRLAMLSDLEKVERPASPDSNGTAVAQQDSSNFTEADWKLDRAVVKRLDWNLCIVCAVTYLLSFLESVDVPEAAVDLVADPSLGSSQSVQPLKHVGHPMYNAPLSKLYSHQGSSSCSCSPTAADDHPPAHTIPCIRANFRFPFAQRKVCISP